MYMIEEIINQLMKNFDFSLMLVINVCTYVAIKILDEINKEKIVGTWQKRIIFVAISLIIGTIYNSTADVPIYIIINSVIVAPVAWSWLAKPIANKLGIDYKHK